jgi:hypothetical protein
VRSFDRFEKRVSILVIDESEWCDLEEALKLSGSFL